MVFLLIAARLVSSTNACLTSSDGSNTAHSAMEGGSTLGASLLPPVMCDYQSFMISNKSVKSYNYT